MERRKRIRFIERNSVTIRCVSPGNNGRRTRAETFDLSTGGARIVAKERYDVGALINIRIDLARSGQSVTAVGEVKWTRFNEDKGLYEIGIEFLRLTSPKILTLIRHLYGQDWKTFPPDA
jgi:c-di-GMP-binding flagellar brake protein YcgR